MNSLGLRGWPFWKQAKVAEEDYIQFFFYQGFLSRTLKTHRTAGKGRGPSFIPLYHFHALPNIQTFTCDFAREMTITYFWSQRLHLPDCYSMRFTTLSNYYLIDWWCNVDFRLFTCWFDIWFLQLFHMRNRWTRTRIDCHPCIYKRTRNRNYTQHWFQKQHIIYSYQIFVWLFVYLHHLRKYFYSWSITLNYWLTGKIDNYIRKYS